MATPKVGGPSFKRDQSFTIDILTTPVTIILIIVPLQKGSIITD